MNALIHQERVGLVQGFEERTPNRHVAGAVCVGFRALTKDGDDVLRGELAPVVFGEKGEVHGDCLERGSGRAVAFAGQTVARGTVVGEHLFARGWIALRDGGLLDDFFLARTEASDKKHCRQDRKKQESRANPTGKNPRVLRGTPPK